MRKSNQQTYIFESIKELRDNYFVEYDPPGGTARFAELILVFYNGVNSATAKNKMETEAEIWTKRYAVPVMVFASDEKDDPIEISSSRNGNHLIAWRHPNGQLEKHWKLLKDEEIPDDALDPDYLLKVYEDIPYRTKEEVREQANRKWIQRRKGIRVGVAIVFWWAAVVPMGIAILGWANPMVGLLSTLYALWIAARKGGLMIGWLKPSYFEKMKREKKRRMDHYYYQCEKNPAGFQRLVAENVEAEERDRIKREADELKRRFGRTDSNR